MMRWGKQRARWVTILILALVFLSGVADGGRAATAFGSAKIEAQWRVVEAAQPNFWGPLATARAAQMEAYREGAGGTRLVQYFDKARMEQLHEAAPITTGLLTIELKSGRLQAGDATFEMRSPARVEFGNIGAHYYQWRYGG